MTDQNYRSCFEVIFRQFASHYGNLWTSQDDIRGKVKYWVEQLSLSNLTEDQLINSAGKITSEHSFIEYPPNVFQLIEFTNRLNKQEDPLYLEVVSIFDFLRSCYLKAKTTTSDQSIDVWYEELSVYGFSNGIITKAIKNLSRNPKFSKFPPILNDLVYESIRLEIDPSLPAVDNAYQHGYLGMSKDHPIFKKVRQVIGSHNLNSSSFGIEKRFSEVYAEKMIEFRKNPEFFIEDETRNSEQDKASYAAKDLKDLLSNW